MNSSGGYQDLSKALGYEFGAPELLARALTHRSFANESGNEVDDNERLEFLGDAVIGLAVGHELMERFPDVAEGQLSVLRAQLVSETGLARAARSLQLGSWLRLGKGEAQTGGRDKSSLLSDAFEAVCAAVYLDGGFEPARALIIRLLGVGLSEIEAGVSHDFKTRLQERAQAVCKEAPVYEVVDATGPDHDKRFTVRVLIAGDEMGSATGRSKKSAEQDAARQALDRFDD